MSAESGREEVFHFACGKEKPGFTTTHAGAVAIVNSENVDTDKLKIRANCQES